VSDDIVHLHVHSDMSNLDGCGKIADYVKKAKEREHRGVAFTDHGTMRGYITQHEQCKEHDVRPIYGIEFYVSPDMRRRGLTDEERADITQDLPRSEHKSAIRKYEERAGIRDRWHLTVWALNQVGLSNLYRLSSSAWIEGFYYKPRIDFKELVKYGEGLAVGSGCLSSPINDCWVLGKRRQSLEYADQLADAFGDRFYLEVQPHAIRDQRLANELMIRLRHRYGSRGIRLLATQDAHYVDRSDATHHDILLCIGMNAYIDESDRFKFDGDEFHFKTRAEMVDSFRRHHEFMSDSAIREALDTTIELASRATATVEMDYHKALLPDPGIPSKYGDDSLTYLKDLCLEGWTWREIPKRAMAHAVVKGISNSAAIGIYRDRLKYELRALVRQKFVPYFLMVRDIYRFAREAKIMTGPGRGSVAGSLVAYCLGLTAVDPIEFGLIFERFINPNRIDMPDVDMDFEDRRRGEIMGYLRHKYGNDRVCQIATIGKLSGKQCLKDVSRVLRVPYAEVNAVTASIIERSSGDERASQTIEDSFRDFAVCRAFNKRYPDVLHHARRLEGMAKNLGIHAAGVVASPVPLTDLMPLEIRKHDGKDIQVSAADMYGVASTGLVKLDVLGLRTLTVIKEALEAIEHRHDRRIDMESRDINLNDPRVLQGFTNHDFGGVFQYDTTSAAAVCRGVKFSHFEDVAALTALNRPGTSRSGLATEYVRRKKKPSEAKKVHFHPVVSEITKDTLGIIVYQEHVIRIFIEVAGFAPGTADSLRKTIAKKIGDETLGKERDNFIEGAMKHTPGMTREIAARIIDAITFFGSYGFNKSHATAYGMIAYWCMWLKIYYPLEFYWALLKNEPDRLRIQQFAKDAKKHGIGLLPPHVNVSDDVFSIDGKHNAIRGSLVDIKGVGRAAAAAVIATKPYANLLDLANRVDRRRVHRGVITALASAGALEGLVPNTRHFVEHIDSWWRALTNKGKRAQHLKKLLLEANSEDDWSKEEQELLASRVNPLAFGAHPVEAHLKTIGRHIAVPIVTMDGDDFFKRYNNSGVYVFGMLVEIKYNQIGDFHTGKMPTEVEKRRMFWGHRYSNINIEDRTGTQNRFKVDFHIFDEHRGTIDKGIGTPVMAFATPMAYTNTLRVHFLVDLDLLRSKLSSHSALDVWESIATGSHPVLRYAWKDSHIREERVNNSKFDKYGGHFCGVVTHIQLKYDKRGGLMAYLGLLAGDGRFERIVIFASVWCKIHSKIRRGMLVRMELERKPDRGGWSCFYNGGHIKLYNRKIPAVTATAAT
jgi:DNA polymerase-3 subunit alpha